MKTNWPYDKGGNTLEEVIDNIFDNLKHKDLDMEIVSLSREGFKEICEHVVEWQSKHAVGIYPYVLDESIKCES